MGALGKLFGAMWGFLFLALGRLLSAKYLMVGAIIAAFLVMLGGLTVLFDALLAGIAVSMPSEFQWGLGIIPGNVPTCVSAILTARLAIWMFQVKWAVAKFKVKAG